MGPLLMSRSPGTVSAGASLFLGSWTRGATVGYDRNMIAAATTMTITTAMAM